jgi:hypothetical protein
MASGSRGTHSGVELGALTFAHCCGKDLMVLGSLVGEPEVFAWAFMPLRGRREHLPMASRRCCWRRQGSSRLFVRKPAPRGPAETHSNREQRGSIGQLHLSQFRRHLFDLLPCRRAVFLRLRTFVPGSASALQPQLAQEHLRIGRSIASCARSRPARRS